jgi:hypothetical protein
MPTTLIFICGKNKIEITHPQTIELQDERKQDNCDFWTNAGGKNDL